MRKLPDFKKPFILYTDGSKGYGFGITRHQLDDEEVERLILFRSKWLANAERITGQQSLRLPHWFGGYNDHGNTSTAIDSRCTWIILQSRASFKALRPIERTSVWHLVIVCITVLQDNDSRPQTEHSKSPWYSLLKRISSIIYAFHGVSSLYGLRELRQWTFSFKPLHTWVVALTVTYGIVSQYCKKM